MLKKPFKKGKKIIKSSKSAKTQGTLENTFLNETSFISEVDMEIRDEIEKKFKKSSVNSNYIFPRKLEKPEIKKKKTPVKSRPQSRLKLVMEKSMPVMHKFTKSTFESTNVLSHIRSVKKMHRVTSSIKSIRETRGKSASEGVQVHSRTNSQQSRRSKTPLSGRESADSVSHRRAISNKRGYFEGVPKQKSVNKKSAHLYTASIETVIPSAIIKSVSYY